MLHSHTMPGLTGIPWSTQVLRSAKNPETDRGEKLEILVGHNLRIGELKKKLEKKNLFPTPHPVNLRKYKMFPLEKNLKGYILGDSL